VKDGIPFLIRGRENPNLCRLFVRKGCYPFRNRIAGREQRAEGCHPFPHQRQGKSKPLQAFCTEGMLSIWKQDSGQRAESRRMASLFSSEAGKIQTFAGFLYGRDAIHLETGIAGKEQKDGIPFLIRGRENPNLCRLFVRKGCYPFGNRIAGKEQRAEGWHPFSHQRQGKSKPLQAFCTEGMLSFWKQDSGQRAESRRMPSLFSSEAGKIQTFAGFLCGRDAIHLATGKRAKSKGKEMQFFKT